METITFHSYRGGVGKTLLSINTAVQLALQGKKVILIDFDLRAPSHRSFLDSSALEITPAKKSFTRYLIESHKPKEVVASTSLENLFCVFSDVELLQQKESKTHSKLTQHGEGKILAKLFEFIRYSQSQQCDFMVIDCMPGITYRSLDALVVSDKVFLVTRPVKSEIDGLSLVISECYSKLEGAKIYTIMNQIEQKEDLVTIPTEKDVELAEQNLKDIQKRLEQVEVPIPMIYSFSRVPFVTERIYVLEEKEHRFSHDIREFSNKILEVESRG
jgi:cellulose biosynthesis protein BcsQ